MFVKKVTVRLKCTSCYSDVKDGTIGFLCWNCGARSTLQPFWNVRIIDDVFLILSMLLLCTHVGYVCSLLLSPALQATVLFDDGTGECMVHAEGMSVLDLLRRPGTEFSTICDLVEKGCRQYGAVRYDSYFSHWNRMDALNNTTHDDEAHGVDEMDMQNIYLPAPLPMQPGGSAGVGANRNSSKTDSVENFYKIFSPAHTVEKELETYLNQKCPSPLLKLQVKIIPEKKGTSTSAVTVNQNSTIKEHVSAGGSGGNGGGGSGSGGGGNISGGNCKQGDIDTAARNATNTITSTSTSNTTITTVTTAISSSSSSSCSSSSIQAGSTHVTDLTNTDESVTADKIGPQTVESLLRSLDQHSDEAALTARNIKIQENNDERPYSISFLSLPTLDVKRLSVEAVSVIYMGDREIREEAWEDLKVLRLAASMRRKSDQHPVNL